MDHKGLSQREDENRYEIINPLGQSFYGQTEYELVCRLDKKKRQLDREIAKFKALKADEYRRFEKQLTDYYKKTGELPEEGVTSSTKAEISRQISLRTPATHSESRQKENANHPRTQKNGGIVAPSRAVIARAVASTSRPNYSSEGSPGLSDPSGPAGENRQPHEHECELHGVFTPNYLPLLDGTTREGDRRSSSELLEASNLDKIGSPAGKRNNAAVLSSSAEYQHQSALSPPALPARPLSASVPHQESLDHRRTSSGSGDTIANRRSSLRNPNAPRSPKRVLFSINDTVVSPSSSPIAQRSKSTAPTKASHFPGNVDKNDNFEIVKNYQGKILPANSSATATKSLLGTSFSGPSNGWNANISPLRWAYESESRNKASSSASGDDFEHVDRDDDVFTFDEDLDALNSRNLKNENQQRSATHEEEAIDDMESQETLVGSSPHAGSLPIEIKWPGNTGSLRGSTP